MLVLEHTSGGQMLKWQEYIDLPLEELATLDPINLTQALGTHHATGLTQEEAEKRLNQVGENRASQESRVNPLTIFIHQFQSSVVLLLLAAAIASLCFQELLQAAGILIAVLINALTGFYMEYKAGTSLAALQILAGQSVRCIRDEAHRDLSVHKLVPGDIVILEPGTRVPADLGMIEAASLWIDESVLTGESAPVFKDSKSKTKELSNVAFHGTLVCSGRGLGVVLKTAERSSLGKLGKLLESAEAGATPLELQLEQLGQQLSIFTVVICAVVTIIGIMQKQELLLMMETGIALAVAAIPEGLPVLATLALALGIQRMVRNHAIVRQLAAMETLGCTNIICTDKTGTLTENQMTVCKVYVKDHLIEVSGTGYAPFGDLLEDGKSVTPADNLALSELLKAAALCNDAKLENDASDGWHIHGDPTEGALLTLAVKGECDLAEFFAQFPRVAELPFDLSRKRMSTIHKETDSANLLLTKGAPGGLIKLCSKVYSNTGHTELDDNARQHFMSLNEKFAQEGLRVLAIAMRSIDAAHIGLESNELESDLTLLGLVAMKDVAREGARQAVEVCKNAGIKVIMLTGDQALTAESIGRELGILDQSNALVGKDLEFLNEEHAALRIASAQVIARVTPELKLFIVQQLQKNNRVVCMTGDGVNDAPAIKQANIGVAMGRSGTDLARSVSNMVITDDNFCTIVKAIEQGRIIYANIQNAVGYLLTASLSSVLTVAFGIIFSVGLPLSPLQLLWLNLIMHIFPGLGIALQRGSNAVMNQGPRDITAKLIAGPQIYQIAFRSLIVSICTLCAVEHAKALHMSTADTTTVGLTTLSLSLLFQAWAWIFIAAGNNKKSSKIKIDSAMIINMILAYGLLFAAVYIPGLTKILGTDSLNLNQMTTCFVLSAIAFALTNAVQFIIQARLNRRA